MMSQDPTPGMATGSDAGAPGDHLPPTPLKADEQELLEELRSDAEDPPEASPEVVRAVEDDAPLPGGPAISASDDPDDPAFSEA